jgi:hypothetical protein
VARTTRILAALFALTLAAGAGGCVDGRDWDWDEDDRRYRRGDRDRYEDRYEDRDRREDRDDHEDGDSREDRDHYEDRDAPESELEWKRGPAGRPRP